MKEIDEKTQQALLLFNRRAEAAEKELEATATVSYTHLTLPTIYSV